MAHWTWEGPRKGRIRKANVFFFRARVTDRKAWEGFDLGQGLL